MKRSRERDALSTSPDASLSPIPLDIPDSGEAVPSEVNSASDPDRDLAINQIAAAIRGARTESGFIPVGPERKRLTNLIRFWMVAIPAVVVFVDIVIKILVHYVSFNEFKAVVGLLALAANGDGHGLPFVLFFLPLGFVFISGLLAIVTAGLALVFSTSPTKRWGSRCVYAVFSLSAVANVGMIIGAAGADFATYVIIFLTSAYVITLASFVYWLISIITRSGRTPWDYTVVATVCLVVTCATVSMLLGIDAYNESQGNGKSASENLRGEGTPEMLDATGDTLRGCLKMGKAGQSAQGEAGHCDVNPGFGGFTQCFVVLAQPPLQVQPAEGALHDPPPGQDLKGMLLCWAPHQLQGPAAHRPGPLYQFAAVGPISPDQVEGNGPAAGAPTGRRPGPECRRDALPPPAAAPVSTTMWRLRPFTFLPAS